MLIGKFSSLLRICLIYLLTYSNINSQNPFNILPNVGGINGQSQAWSLYLDTNKFYVIGDLLDTLTDGSAIVFPWLADFNYDGEIQNINLIEDSPIEYPFKVTRNAIYKNSNNNFWIYGSQRFSQGSTHPKLIEVNEVSGEIIKSIHIDHPIDSNLSLTKGLMLASDSLIILTSFYWTSNHYNLYLVFLDKDLNVQNSFLLANDDYNNIVYHLETEGDSTLILVGDSRLASDQSNFPEVKPFLTRITFNGEILEHKIASGLAEKTILFPIAYTSTVTRDDKHNWVLSCVNVVETHLCQTCHYLLPYTFSISSNFDTVHWVTKFKSLAPHNDSQPIVASSLRCSDNSGYITAGFDNYGFIYKVNNIGDSVWLRKYIPLSLGEEKTLWCELVDLKETIDKSFILSGRASDKELNAIRSWIIQIDSAGCIVPGCDSTVGIAQDNKESIDYFSIFPNPASDMLYILNKHLDFMNCRLTINNIFGQVIKYVEFSSNIGDQYMVSLDTLTPGMYTIAISDKKNRVYYSNQIVVK